MDGLMAFRHDNNGLDKKKKTISIGMFSYFIKIDFFNFELKLEFVVFAFNG